MLHNWNTIKDEGKEISRTPRFILVHPSSWATSSLFSNKQRISLKDHQDQSKTIQLHLLPTRNPLHTTTHNPYTPQKPITVQNPTAQIQIPNLMQFELQTTNPMYFATQSLKI